MLDRVMKYDFAVVALGYVGSLLAIAAGGAGLQVLGFDIHPRVIRTLSGGYSQLDPVTPPVEELRTAATQADLTLVLTHHDAFDLDAIGATAQLVFDTRGQLSNSNSHVERV